MKYKTRNKKIAELYSTANFTFTQLAKRFDLSAERITQIIKREIGLEKINEVKKNRKIKAAEKLKEAYLKNI